MPSSESSPAGPIHASSSRAKAPTLLGFHSLRHDLPVEILLPLEDDLSVNTAVVSHGAGGHLEGWQDSTVGNGSHDVGVNDIQFVTYSRGASGNLSKISGKAQGPRHVPVIEVPVHNE